MLKRQCCPQPAACHTCPKHYGRKNHAAMLAAHERWEAAFKTGDEAACAEAQAAYVVAFNAACAHAQRRAQA